MTAIHGLSNIVKSIPRMWTPFRLALAVCAGLLLLVYLAGKLAYPGVKNQSWTVYPIPDSGEWRHDNVSVIAEDSQNRLWVFTGTLWMLSSDGDWTQYTPPHGSAFLAIGGDDRIWVGSSGYDSSGSLSNGLSVLSPQGSWTSYSLSDSDLPDERYFAMAVDEQDRVWIGGYGGLSVLAPDGSSKTYTDGNSGLVNDFVFKVTADSQGRIWAGTPEGLSVLAPDGRWTTYTSVNSPLEFSDSNSVTVDRQGVAWIADMGLHRLNPDGTWKSYTVPGKGFPLDCSYCVAVDEQGQVWVGGEEGISMLAPDGSWTSYTLPNADPQDSTLDDVHAILADHQGRIWVGSENGLIMLDPAAAESENQIFINVWPTWGPRLLVMALLAGIAMLVLMLMDRLE